MGRQADNAAAIIFAQRHMINQKTKHIGIAYHFVREKFMEGFAIILKIGTQYNFADILTKPLTTGERTRWLAQHMMGIMVIAELQQMLFRPTK